MGRLTSARAIASRCFCPPLSCTPRSPHSCVHPPHAPCRILKLTADTTKYQQHSIAAGINARCRCLLTESYPSGMAIMNSWAFACRAACSMSSCEGCSSWGTPSSSSKP